jgi:hypothetical protein
MELTIKKPAVTDPSHIPRMRRATKRLAKLLQAAWQHKATPHMKMFKLEAYHFRRRSSMQSLHNQPHPFSDGKPLQRQVLGELEDEISEIEDRS